MATRILVVDDSPTIRTVVSTILERHGYDPKVAIDGQDAYDALSSGEVKADLVLVDFVMPRLNGFQFCRALRDNAELAGMPVVLMSAKGDRIRDQFVQQTGALDAITKPFDAQALLAVIENALRKVNQGRVSSSRLQVEASSHGLPDLDFDEATGVTSEAFRAAEPALVETETKRTELGQAVAKKLAAIVTTTLASLPEVISPETLSRALEERLTNESVLELMGLERERSAASAVLSGDLGVVPIGAVLQLLQAEIQTGVLVCRHGDAEIRATFREGLIDLVEASGAGAAFRLGRFFVHEGILSAAEIDEVMQQQAAAEKPVPLGMALLAAGKIVEDQLKSALTNQSNELLYEMLRWPSGRFELRREPPSELATNARLGMPVASAVMEGFRRVDEWRALERSLGSFDDVLLRDDAAFGSVDVGSLPAREKAVLDAVDGERTVRAIVTASNLPSFDACRILVQFLEARVLRRRGG